MPLYLGNNLISGMGLPGKSAYEQAKEGGYAGTEAEFIELLTNAATKDYVDEAIGEIPTPDVSGQIGEHNADENAHADIRTAVGNAQTAADSKAPIAHAVNTTTYGIGTANVYGHVKISDKVDSTSAANAGIASSPAAVKTAYDLANTANTAAQSAQTTAASKAPMYTYGTEDLTAGTSPLASGQLHFVYE